jgi:hypothetical protein
MIAPKNANVSPLPSRSHNQIEYPPPISKMPARMNRRIVYTKHLSLDKHLDSRLIFKLIKYCFISKLFCLENWFIFTIYPQPQKYNSDL